MIAKYSSLSTGLALGLVLFVLFQPLAVHARHDQMTEFFRDICRTCEQKMLDARETLEGLEAIGWDDALLAEYQVAACFMVHNAVVAYLYEYGCLPEDLHGLAGTYFTEWPVNPQNGWQPIEVLSSGAAFSAGDFVLQECPVAYQSLVNNHDEFSLVALSYELSVYGPYPGHYQELVGKVTNTDWAMVPAGAVAIAGSRTESAEQMIEKLRQQKTAAAAQEELAESAAL